MAKVQVNLKLSKDASELLNNISSETGKTKAAIIEESLSLYYKNINKDLEFANKSLEILEEQNKQLQIALSTLNKITEEKERLIEEKEKRIQDLLKTIDLLEAKYKKFDDNNKSWWQFWKK